MAGCKQGVAKRFLEISQKALFVHCHGHRLNLALSSCAQKIKEVRDTVHVVEELSVFVERSAKRHALFQFLQTADNVNEKTKAIVLKLFADTRWGSHTGSFSAVTKTLPHVKTFLTIVSEEEKTNIGATATGLLKWISNFTFVFYCRALNELFIITNRLSEYLQGSTVDVGMALNESFVTTIQIEDMKSDKSTLFEEIYCECRQFCMDHGFTLPLTDRRKRRFDQDENGNETKATYQLTYDALLSGFVDEIRLRFDRHCYEPAIELFELIKNTHKERKLNFSLLKIYENDLDLDKLQAESIGFVYHKISNPGIDWHDFNVTVNEFSRCRLKEFYPQLHKAIKIYLSIPIGSVQAERSFSCLKLLKNWLRTTMLNERLSDITMIKMSKDLTIDYDDLILQFSSLCRRKMDFF
jgi:hypothetical protein